MTTPDARRDVGADPPPVVLFDGVCNLCAASVVFILRHERRPTLRFASLQSPAGRRLLVEHGLDPDAVDSVVMLEDGRAHVRSEAALRIARRLRAPWRWAAMLGLLPRGVRDRLYDAAARRRYRLFGRREACMVPDEPLRARFLDGGSG